MEERRTGVIHVSRLWAVAAIACLCWAASPALQSQLLETPIPQESAAPRLGDAPPAPDALAVARLPRRDWRPFNATLPGIDTSSRERVRNNFNAVYMASALFNMGWTGDHYQCVPGTTADAFREQVQLRLNYFRAMAGIPAWVAFLPANNAKNQAAALMMSANNQLSHFPDNNWDCWSSDGTNAAANSNIAIGSAGPDALDAYMDDHGGNNAPVGHRRWLLYPQTQIMGTGDIPYLDKIRPEANAVWVFDGHYWDARPPVRDGFVAWPPPGFVPNPIVYTRWSCAHPQASFSSASVTLSSNGVPVAVTIEPFRPNIGENTLVWYPAGMDTLSPSDWPRPAADTVFAVSVRNVTLGGQTTNFNYTVTVMDPAAHGPDTVLPKPAGPANPAVGASSTYSFASVPGAGSYGWRRSTLSPFNQVEGGENGLADFDVRTSPGYEVLVTLPVASGQHAFQLAHPVPASQSLIHQSAVVPRPGAQLRFSSRLGWATPSQVATVEITLDDGVSWQPLYVQAGSDGAGEQEYARRTVSLESYSGRTVRFRFSYQYLGGTYFPQTDAGVGWNFDDISWVNVDEVTQPVDAAAGAGSFNFTPPAAGSYALQVRGVMHGAYPLEWGPVTEVTATVAPVPPQLLPPTLGSGVLQLSWTGGNPPFYVVRKAALQDSQWTEVAGPIAGSTASVPIQSNEGYYQIRGQ